MKRSVRVAGTAVLVAALSIGATAGKGGCSFGQQPKLAGVTNTKPIGWTTDGQPIYVKPIWKKPVTKVYGPKPTKPPVSNAVRKGRNLGWQWIRRAGRRGHHGAPVWQVGRIPGNPGG